MPEPGTVVSEFTTKDGREVTIRYVQEGDAPAVLMYINDLSAEKTFVLMQGEKKTLDDEKGWVTNGVDEARNGRAVTLVADYHGRIVGISGVKRGNRVESHVATLGLSTAHDFRGQGLGGELFRQVLDQAEQHITGLRIIELGVFGNNPVAYRLYQKVGFMEYGRLPQGILHRGEYVDHVLMYRPVQRETP